MAQAGSVYDYIITEENNFKSPIDLNGWQWSFVEHVKMTFYYKHGRLLTGNTDDKPVRNTVRPILNLQYRTEDLDVKDINIYVDDPDKHDLSFFVKKYHDEVFLRQNNIDDFLDDANESRIDYGGALLKDNDGPKPDVVPLDSIAFCDQTDILSGPICIKHFYSPDQLKEFEKKGWGNPARGATINIDELILLARAEKEDDKNDHKTAKTPGKYIKIYELHGNLPTQWLNEQDETGEYITQLQIVAFYQKEDGNSEGVTLFRGKERKSPFKISLRDKIPGRALGFGGVEELEEDQVWINYSQIKFKQFLDSAADTYLQTTDSDFMSNQRVVEFDGKKVVIMNEGKTMSQIDTYPRNINLFDKYVRDWEEHAQLTGAANDSIMGDNPPSGTPFKLQNLITKEAHGLHEFRRGKFSKDIEEVYRDWIIPYIAKEIKNDQKFLASLTLDEMQFVADKYVKRRINELVKSGQLDLMDIDQKKEELYADFLKNNKKFISWVKGELSDLKLSISINIAGKQKDLYLYTDKLVNVFRQLAAAPQLLNDPRMVKIFNQILESSGLEPVDFNTYQPLVQQQPVQASQTAPINELINNNNE